MFFVNVKMLEDCSNKQGDKSYSSAGNVLGSQIITMLKGAKVGIISLFLWYM